MPRPSLSWFTLSVAAATVVSGALLAWGLARNDPWTWFHIVASGPEAARALPDRMPPPYEPLNASLENQVAVHPLSCTGLPLVDLEFVEQVAIADWGSDPWLSVMVVIDDPANVETTLASFDDPLCAWEGVSFYPLPIEDGWRGSAVGYSFTDSDQGVVEGTIAMASEGRLLLVVQHEALGSRPPSAQTKDLLEIAIERARRPYRAWLVPTLFGGFLLVGVAGLWFPKYVLTLWVANLAVFVFRSPWAIGPFVLIALIAVGISAGRAFQRLPRQASLERADTEGAPDPAAALVAEQLKTGGFVRAGILRFTLGNVTELWQVLLSPDRTVFVVTTDLFNTVYSRFGPRLLITSGSGQTAVSPTVLRITVVGQSASEMVQAHRRSLEVLASVGYKPDELDEVTLIDEYVESEIAELAWVCSLSWLAGLRLWANILLRIHLDRRALDHDSTGGMPGAGPPASSLARIHEWWESGSLTHRPPQSTRHLS